MALLTKENRILLKFYRHDNCYSARQLSEEFYHRQWSRLSLSRLLQVQRVTNFLRIKLYILLKVVPPFPQIDIIGDVVIVWRVRGKIIRSVLCNIMCNNCAQCDAHT